MLYKNSILTVWFRILEATSYLLVFVDNHAGTGRVKVTTGSMDHKLSHQIIQLWISFRVWNLTGDKFVKELHRDVF